MAHQGREYWSAVVSEFEQSGLRQSEFTRPRNINIGTFRSWLYRLRRERSVVEVHSELPGSGSSRVFVEVEVESEERTPQRALGSVAVELPNGVVIRFECAISGPQIAELALAVGGV